MLAGARDFLTKPPDVDELTSAIRRAGEMAHQEKMKEATTLAAVQAAGPSTGGLFFPSAVDGKIITVFSPKGGTGATTITANTAIALHSEENPVVAVDGRLQFGDLSFFFNVQTKNTVLDLAPRGDELDPEIVEEVLMKHEGTGVSILAAPARPEHAEEVTGEQFGKVLRFLRRMFAYVIVDTSSGLDSATLAAVDSSDLIAIVATQDFPAIKNVRLFLDLMDALGVDRNKIVTLMNRFDKRRNVTPERIGEITKSEVVAVLPLDERLVIPSTDRGIPFIIENKNNPVAKGVLGFATAIKKRIEEIKQAEAEAI
jgi:pilus assembly protein CpaE